MNIEKELMLYLFMVLGALQSYIWKLKW